MREILFRGKRLDNGEWTDGYIYEHEPALVGIASENDVPEPSKWFIARTGFADWNMPRPVEFVEIDPSTVGQYTGLKDKNGKRIFEGDIVDGQCHSAWSHRLQRCDIAYGRNGFEARNHIDGLDSDYYTYRVLFSKDVVIIGNIHDNPELLEK